MEKKENLGTFPLFWEWTNKPRPAEFPSFVFSREVGKIAVLPFQIGASSMGAEQASVDLHWIRVRREAMDGESFLVGAQILRIVAA